MNNDTDRKQTIDPNDFGFDEAFEDLEEIGRTWAIHGLQIGKSALESGALTLRNAAAILDHLSKSFLEAAARAEPDAGTDEKPS